MHNYTITGTKPIPPLNHINNIEYKKGQAIIDLNTKFLDLYNQLPGSSSLLFLDSLTNTLAQHPQIEKVTVTINGKENIGVSNDGLEFGEIIIRPAQRIVNYYNPLGYKVDANSIVFIYLFIPELLDYEHQYGYTSKSGETSFKIIEIDEYMLIPVSLQLSSTAKVQELISIGLAYLTGEQPIQYNNLVSIFPPKTQIIDLIFINNEIRLNFRNFPEDKRLQDEMIKYISRFFKQFTEIKKINIYSNDNFIQTIYNNAK